jgi:hypothetical protein
VHAADPVNLILLDLIILTVFGEEDKQLTLLVHNFHKPQEFLTLRFKYYPMIYDKNTVF